MSKSLYVRKVKPNIENIEKWARTDNNSQIAEKLGISLSSLKNYMNQYPDLKTAITNGRQDQIKVLKLSLLALANGYEETETTVKIVEQIDDNTTKTTIKKKRQVAPNLRAATIMLSQLDPDFHSDKDLYELKKQALQLKEQTQTINEEWESIG